MKLNEAEGEEFETQNRILGGRESLPAKMLATVAYSRLKRQNKMIVLDSQQNILHR